MSCFKMYGFRARPDTKDGLPLPSPQKTWKNLSKHAMGQCGDSPKGSWGQAHIWGLSIFSWLALRMSGCLRRNRNFAKGVARRVSPPIFLFSSVLFLVFVFFLVFFPVSSFFLVFFCFFVRFTFRNKDRERANRAVVIVL